MKNKNVTLIGMSGVGKSSIGVLLAELLKWEFVDTDTLLEEDHSKSLQKILDDVGEEEFVKLELDKIKTLLNATHTVLSPGGSIIYSSSAMDALKDISTVIFLEADPKIIEARIKAHTRGIVGLKAKGFQELYREREVFYKKYADYTVNTDNKTTEQVAKNIADVISQEV